MSQAKLRPRNISSMPISTLKTGRLRRMFTGRSRSLTTSLDGSFDGPSEIDYAMPSSQWTTTEPCSGVHFGSKVVATVNTVDEGLATHQYFTGLLRYALLMASYGETSGRGSRAFDWG